MGPDREHFRRRIAALGAGDRSVLEAALQNPDSQMLTTEGSANHVLWSEMAQIGWMTELPLPEGFPEFCRIYALTEEGSSAIPDLIGAAPP
ncbi:MAG TPA: hypothetical protein VF601_14115 [Beijerinckiaceae bacterium]|jgi:hypothetical protein